MTVGKEVRDLIARKGIVIDTDGRLSRLRYLWKCGQLFVTLALIYWVVQRLDWNLVWTNVLTAKIEWLALALTYPFLSIGIDALRWGVLLGSIRRLVAWHKLFRVNLVGIFFDNFLPGNIGSDGYRTVSLSKQYPPREVLATVLVNRVVSWFGLLILGLGGLLILQDELPIDVLWSSLFVLSAGLCLTAVGLVLVTASDRWKSYGWYDRILRRWKHVNVFLENLKQMLTRRIVIVTVSLSLMLHTVVIGATVVIAKAYGIHPKQLLFVACVAPLGLIAAMLPISIGGHGVRETAFIYLLSKVGITPEVALVIAVTLYVILAVASLTGGAVVAFSKMKSVTMETAESIAPQ